MGDNMSARAVAGVSALAIVATVMCLYVTSTPVTEEIKEVPDWVHSERDLDIWLQDKAKNGDKVVHKNTGTHRVVNAVVDEDVVDLLQMDAEEHDSAPVDGMEDMMEVPKYVSSEADLDSYLEIHGMKTVKKEIAHEQQQTKTQAKQAKSDIMKWMSEDPQKTKKVEVEDEFMESSE